MTHHNEAGAAAREGTERHDRHDLERRYGCIGISAVAAAARYTGSNRTTEEGRARPIPARFEDDAA